MQVTPFQQWLTQPSSFIPGANNQTALMVGGAVIIGALALMQARK
jgi:hypothetical protein